MSVELTIITATYNRARSLERLYKSLNNQMEYNFEWIIIDDGSLDDTEGTVKSVARNCLKFDIKYYKKENQGKHVALNYSHQYISGRFCMVVDDDDVLPDDAIKTILCYIKKYGGNPQIGCICFQKADFNKKPLVDWKGNTDIISNTIDFRINQNHGGDCAEVVRTEVFCQYPFPIFDGEKFLSEDNLWIKSAYKYDTVYVKKIVYLAEYLEDGLTRNKERNRLKDPIGKLYNYNLYFDKRFKLAVKAKKAILYNCCALKSGRYFYYMKRCDWGIWCYIFAPIALPFYLKWKR